MCKEVLNDICYCSGVTINKLAYSDIRFVQIEAINSIKRVTSMVAQLTRAQTVFWNDPGTGHTPKLYRLCGISFEYKEMVYYRIGYLLSSLLQFSFFSESSANFLHYSCFLGSCEYLINHVREANAHQMNNMQNTELWNMSIIHTTESF